jgi:long-subunit acyl-CoA synthetase (AMP-forming)
VTAPLVAQIFVYGDSLKDVLVAVIVPDVEVVKLQPQWGQADLASLCANAAFIEV